MRERTQGRFLGILKTLFSPQKLVRFLNKHNVGDIVITTLLITSWLFSPFAPLFDGSTWRFPAGPAEKAEAASGDVILLWDTADGAIPSGWTCISCATSDPLINAFIRVAASYGVSTTSADTMTHTATFSSAATGAATGHNSNTAGTAFPISTHTHTWGNPTLSTVDIKPLYQNLKLIKKSNPTSLPINIIGMFDTSSLPTNWTRYTAMDGDDLRGGNDNTSGGAATHTHTTTAGVTSGATSGSYTDPGNGTTVAGPTHTHTIASASATASDNNNPPYITVVFAKLGVDNSALPNGLLALFDATPPVNWENISTSTTSYYQRFLQGSATPLTTGGSATHTHGGTVVWTSGAPSATGATGSGSLANVGSNTHTHAVTYTIGSGSSVPVYRDMILGKLTATFTMQGNIYSDRGSTADTTAGRVIKVRVGTSTPGIFATTTVSGTSVWRISNMAVTGIASGTRISAWVDGDSNYRAVTFTKASTTPAHTMIWDSVDLYKNRLIVSHAGLDTATSTTNTDLDWYDGNDNSSIPYTVTTGDLNVLAGKELYVWPAKKFAPGGWVTMNGNAAAAPDGDVYIGTGATLVSSGVSVAGSWNNQGTHTAGNAVNFMATTTGKTLAGTMTGTSAFSSIGFYGTGNWTFSNNASTTGEFLHNGTGTVTAPLMLSVGSYNNSNTGTFTAGGSTLYIENGTSAVNIAGNLKGTSALNNVILVGTGAVTFSSNASTSNLTIASSTTLIAPTLLTVSGHFINNGTFSDTNGTIYFSSTTAQTLSGGLQSAFTFATTTFQGAGTKTFANNASTSKMVIESGSTVVAPPLLTIFGDYTNSGTFTNSSGTVYFSATSTISGNLTGTSAFNSVVVSSSPKVVFITNTSATSWTVPSDWNSANNKIEVIGGGGGAGLHAGLGTAGGGGGAYSMIQGLSLTAGSSVTIQVGTGGAVGGGTGGDTWFNGANLAASSVGAKGAAGATGGQSGSGTGTTKYSGGTGGALGENGTGEGGGAGGGAAGPYGAGGNGGTNLGSVRTVSGTGGGGGGGGSNGNSDENQGVHTGGNNYLGTGGGAVATAGTNGGGGGGNNIGTGSAGAGGAGTEWDLAHGSGGGGGGGSENDADGGGNAGLYGAGGGGKGAEGGGTAKAGAQGIIVITYTPVVGPVTVSSNASTSNLTIGSGATLTAPALLTIGGNYSNSGTFTHNSGTVYFSSGSAQSISGTLSGTSAFASATFVGAGTKTFSNNASTSNFSISSGSTVVAPSLLSISGNYSNSGTFTNSSGMLYFSGSSAQTISGTLTGSSAFASTTFLGAGTKLFSSNATTSSFIIDATSGAVTAPSFLSVTGNFTNSGTFTHGSGEVFLAGSTLQTITGASGSSAFNKLTVLNVSGTDPDSAPGIKFNSALQTAGLFKVDVADAKLQFKSAATSTFASWYLDGKATGSRIYLRSTDSGTWWGLAVTGASTVTYVNVADSRACSGNPDITQTNSFDAGGNTCWTFSPVITVASAVNQPTTVYRSTGDITLGTASISRGSGSGSVTAVTVKENGGTIDATNLSNVKLWLSYDNAWSSNDELLGSAGTFNGADGTITFTETFTATTGPQYLIVRGDIGSGASSGQTIEIQIQSLTTSDGVSGTPLDISGSSTVANGPTISSAATQSFSVGDGTTAMSTITITDGATPTITAANDIRITIPDALDMTWDTTDTTMATSSASFDSYTEQLYTTDVPVITIDLSGVTYNPLTNSVFMIVNGTPQINEFSVDGTWRRTITMSGFIDTEGIAWMYGTKYAVTEERSPYDIVVVDIGPSTTSITKAGGTIIDPAITFVSNLGFEGITYDPVNDWFYAVSEANAAGTASGGGRVFKILLDGSFTEYTTLNSALFAAGATDLADIAYDRASGHLFILSQEAETVYEADLSGNIYDTMAVSKYFQPEGFALSWDNSQMFIVSETNEYSYFNRGAASTSVSYENSGKTLVLNTYLDFNPNDSITVSGLSFKNFNSATGPDYLDLIVGGSGAIVAATDDKSKSIIVPVPITVSGRLYSDEGSTLVTSGKTIKIVIGTSTPGVFTTTSNGSGAWQISPNSFAVDTSVVAWVDGDSSFRAATFTIASSSVNNIPNIDLYQNRVIVKSESTSGSITNALLGGYDGIDDNDIQYSVSGSDLTVAKGQELYIWAGKTFAPGGAVTLHGNGASAPDGDIDLKTGATFTAGGAVTLAGGWNADSSAVFNANAQTVVFNATTTGKTISVPASGHDFYSINFNGSNGDWSFSSAATTSDLTITAGSVTAPSSRLSLLGNYSNSGTFTHNSGTLIFASTSAQTIGGTLIGSSALGNVTARGSGAKTFNAAASTTNLTIETGSSVTGPSTRLTIAGNYTNNGTFTHNAGTTTFNGTSGQAIAGTLTGSSVFRNLEFIGSGSKTFSANASTTNLFVMSGSGTVTAGSQLSIGGTYYNAGTFDSNSGKIYFSGTGSQTALGTMTGTSKFADVQIKGSQGAQGAGTWFNQSFAYRKKITLSGSKLGTTTSSFPVLIDLTDTDLATNAQADFDDVIFVDSTNTTQLDHELEAYSATTGQISAWVETSIASSTDTDIYMYYGNPGAVSTATTTGVWDRNYVAVYHFGETSGNYLDSTKWHHDADIVNVTSRTGGGGGGVSKYPFLNGTTANYIGIPDTSGTTTEYTGFDMYQWTLEAYINETGAGVVTGDSSGGSGLGTNVASPIITKGKGEAESVTQDVQFYFARMVSSKLGVDFENYRTGASPSANTPLQGTRAVATSTWNYVVAAVDPDQDILRTYVNGLPDNQLTTTFQPSQGGTMRVGIGTAFKTTGIDNASSGFFQGYIDEVRISNSYRHPYWIWTTGNNLTSTSTFYTVGSQESPGRSVTFVDPATVKGLTIESGVTFNAPALGTLTIEGNYYNLGTFAHNNGTTTFGGSTYQTISGVATGTSAFYNVEITNSSGSDAESSPSVQFLVVASTTNNFYAVTPNSKIVFPAGATATTTIGNLILNGQALGTKVTLRSSSPGSFWGLAVSGLRSIRYANAKDSNACSGYTTIDASNGTNTDGGNNICWDFGATGSPTLFSSDQVYEIGQSSALAPGFTIVDLSSPVITAAGDLRIAIATSSVNMLWLTNVGTVTVGGTASGKVSSSVTYEGGGSVAVIPVDTNFSSSDTLTIAGLHLTSFNTVVPATNAFTLFLSGATDITADATDTATVAIKGKYVLQDHTLGQVTNIFSGLESSLSATPVFRFAIVPTGETVSISNFIFDLSSVSGISSSDITNAGLYIDYNGDGNIDATDLQVGGAGSVSISGNTGTITFASSFSATTTRNYILKADIASISAGDRVTFKLLTGAITSSGATSLKSIAPTGSVSQIAHTRARPGGSGVAGSAQNEIGGAGAPGAGTVGGGNNSGGTGVGGQGGNGNGTVGGGSSGGGGEI